MRDKRGMQGKVRGHCDDLPRYSWGGFCEQALIESRSMLLRFTGSAGIQPASEIAAKMAALHSDGAATICESQ
jgi:hypothetical protein